MQCKACQQSLLDSTQGQIVRVHSQYFHREHLTCQHCKVLLQQKSYKFKSRSFLCIDCYMIFAHPKCPACDLVIYEEGVRVQNLLLHKSCVKCAECHLILKDNQYYQYHGRIFDECCFFHHKLKLKTRELEKSYD